MAQMAQVWQGELGTGGVQRLVPEGLVLNQWHLYKYRQQSPNPVLKCSTDLLLYHDTHRFARTEYTQTLLVVGYTPCEVLAALV